MSVTIQDPPSSDSCGSQAARLSTTSVDSKVSMGMNPASSIWTVARQREGTTQPKPLADVRAHINSAMEALTKAQEPAPDVLSRIYNAAFPGISTREARAAEALEAVRSELCEAESALRSLERAGEKNSVGRSHWNHFKNVGDEGTREWLRSNFEHQPSYCLPSDEHFERQSSDLERPPSRTMSDSTGDTTLAELLENGGCFDFDALRYSTHPKIGMQPITLFGAHMEDKSCLIQRLSDSSLLTASTEIEDFRTTFLGFLSKLDELYKPDAIYHSSAHAVDVMSTSMWFMGSDYLATRNNPLEYFMTLVAAAIHDVGHPGVNNLFLINTQDPLALRYNDRSVLESMHVALAFETMQSDEECNWFGMFGETAKKMLRPGLIGMVLATDMATHATMLNKFQEFGKNETAATDHDHKFLLETVLHASDISNPSKAHSQMLGWTQRITEEFWTQGDEEQKLGLPISPMCERSVGRASVPNGQIGFINFVVVPYFKVIEAVIAEARTPLEGLERNKSFWEDAKAQELSFDDIFPSQGRNV